MRKSQFIAIFVAVFALIWILSGVLGGGDVAKPEHASEQVKAEHPLMIVRVASSVAQTHKDTVEVTGRTQASRKVDLKAETAGQVRKIHFEEGVYVKSGAVLAVVEPRERNARLEEAQQKVAQAQIEYDAARTLFERGFGSKVRLSSARAALDGAIAARKAVEIDLNKTNIIAPFDGFLSVQHVETGDVLSVGSPVFTIVDSDPIEVVAYVSEHDVRGITQGQEAKVTLINGETVSGEVTYIAPAADERTRTFRILVSLPNETGEIKEGITADVYLPAADIKAHKISPAILSLNNEGRIGIKAVDMNSTVVFYPVEVLSDSADFMWIGGLPENLDIITVGQNFVTAGQEVKAVNEAAQ